MALATSKPTVFAEKIVEGFGLAPYFTLICGSNLDGTRSVKAEIIEQVLFDCKARPKDAVMIGDRKHDLIGAKRCGIASVGVLYGYGSREEMEEYGADYIVPTVPALADLLCG